MIATMTPRRTLRAAGATDVGRRRTVNEDRFHVDASRGIFIVVDGIGGHAAGDKAADMAIATIRERLDRQTGPVRDRIREAITIANNEIHRVAATRPDWYGMACVVTVAVVDGDRAVVGHVGDSRLYRLRGDEIDKITPDHSPVGEREDANELSELEAMRHPRRNEVYRDVGSEPRAITDREFVFLTDVELTPDAALLICSDGLTDQVPAEIIRQIVRTAGRSPEQVARALIGAANDAGGKDNVTVVFVQGERFPSGIAAALPLAAGTNGNRSRSRWLLSSALLAATLAGFALGWMWHRLEWTGGAATRAAGAPAPHRIAVQPHESIAAALAGAAPGTTIVVEPGEYRERLALGHGVRVVSRVPRGATLRLPEGAAERDAAVMAVDIEDAELAGFRIVGDAATPLGIGVVVQDASVRLVDIEVTGAATAGLELGRGDALLAGSDIHDNPGSALVVRRGATPRLTHNVFARNAASAGSRPAFVLAEDARPAWLGNVFQDIGPESIGGDDGAARAALEQDNWFVGLRPKPRPPAAGTRPPAAERGGRGR